MLAGTAGGVIYGDVSDASARGQAPFVMLGGVVPGFGDPVRPFSAEPRRVG